MSKAALQRLNQLARYALLYAHNATDQNAFFVTDENVTIYCDFFKRIDEITHFAKLGYICELEASNAILKEVNELQVKGETPACF